MTKPTVDITSILPAKAKAWVTLVGGLLAVIVPSILTLSDSLPQPWPFVIGGFVALLTTLGVYHAPYTRAGTTLAVDPSTPVAVPTDAAPVALPAPEVVAESVPVATHSVPRVNDFSRYQNPWTGK